MRNKVLATSGMILAFVLGLVASGFTGQAFNKSDAPLAINDAASVTTAPVVPARGTVTRAAFTPSVVRSPQPVYEPVKPANKRTMKKEALIIGGSAGAGAAIGAVSAGKKGAAIGAISGGVAGLIYDMATRNK